MEDTVTDGEGTPAISVVMPTHDVGAWVDECLTSLLHDQDVDLEVVVVDDDSRDDTWTRVSAWAARDPRVRAFQAPGVGGGQARNFGVEMARGEYLAFVDGDDLVPRGAYAAMLASARESGSQMVVGDFVKFSALQTWSPTARWTGFADRVQGTTLVERPQLVRNRACWNRLFRRDFWREEAIAFPSVPRSNDVVPMVTALVAARSIDVVPDLVYLYRERPGGTSMTSQAGAEVGVTSYLSQELLCARLLGPVDGEQLAATYWQMVLDSDAWVHLRKFVRERAAAEDREPSPIPAMVGELLALRRDRSWSRLRPEKQVVYALATLDEAGWARAVLDAFGDGGVTPVAMDPAQALRAALAADPTGLVEPEAMRRFVFSHVVETVAGLTEPLALDDAVALVALAGQRTSWFADPVGGAERPQDTRIREALHDADLEALREVVVQADAVVAADLTVRTDRAVVSVRLPVSMTRADEITLRAFKPGRPQTQRGVSRLRSRDGVWRGTVLASALPTEGTWALELLTAVDGVPVQVPLVIDRSSISLQHGRLGRLTVRGKEDGQVPLTVFRRASAARRAVRALRRRRR
ncbi:glycosyltransferase family 2 protein [Cellulomonas sp. DKR-3]|uniref:Glycosyltransferase family 2 protein n=1 Tax=Cellulomonas fulva TaxID=2835530 RepID=A0ABS5TZK5_9CELL|nr:glycosyltransferase family 2 protein [Cellulomonas fulva]MBT0994588.1 glycosyltransferase family 2 protein [Cellulomonas fulva]